MPYKLVNLFGALFIGLTLVFFALLFVYEQGKCGLVEDILSTMALLMKLLVLIMPLPLVISNRLTHQIDNKACMIFGLYSLFMVWLFFIR